MAELANTTTTQLSLTIRSSVLDRSIALNLETTKLGTENDWKNWTI
jgi:hypothetical protein